MSQHKHSKNTPTTHNPLKIWILSILSIIIIITTISLVLFNTVSSIKSEDSSYFLDEFAINKHQITLNYLFGNTKTIPLSTKMLNDQDQEKLTKTGKHQITINYRGRKTNVTITIYNMLLDDFLFQTLETGECVIIEYLGTSKNIAIKNIYENHIIIGIGEYAFENSKITSVYLSPSIKYLGNYSFIGCTNLTTINLDNVIGIGDGAFLNCDSLTTITIGNLTEGVGFGAFNNCNNLTTLMMPYLFEDYLGYIFGASSSIENDLYLPESLTNIIITQYIPELLSASFFQCRFIKSIIFEEGVGLINPGAFQLTLSLSELIVNSPDYQNINGVIYSYDLSKIIVYPAGLTNDYFEVINSVKTIEAYAFSGSKLSKIFFNQIEYINQLAFEDNDNLETLDFPQTLKLIEIGAFYDCDKLIEVVFSAESLLQGAVFDSCDNLRYIYTTGFIEIEYGDAIGNLLYNQLAPIIFVESDLYEAYINNEVWELLKSYLYPNNYQVRSNDEYRYLYGEDIVILEYLGDQTVVTIPETINDLPVVKIGPRAFVQSQIEEITFNKSIKRIEEFAFFEITTLKKVITSPNLISIATGGFFGCSNLMTLEITNQVTIVDPGYLDDIFIASNNIDHNVMVIVPDHLLDSYHQDQYWSKFGNKVVSGEVEVLENDDWRYAIVNQEIYLIKCLSEELNIIIPDQIDGITVTKLVANAFVNLRMTTITFNQPIIIDSGLFIDCDELDQIIVAKGLLSYYQDLFTQQQMTNYVHIVCEKE